VIIPPVVIGIQVQEGSKIVVSASIDPGSIVSDSPFSGTEAPAGESAYVRPLWRCTLAKWTAPVPLLGARMMLVVQARETK
jgi:hypothetical protein